MRPAVVRQAPRRGACAVLYVRAASCARSCARVAVCAPWAVWPRSAALTLTAALAARGEPLLAVAEAAAKGADRGVFAEHAERLALALARRRSAAPGDELGRDARRRREPEWVHIVGELALGQRRHRGIAAAPAAAAAAEAAGTCHRAAPPPQARSATTAHSPNHRNP